MEYTDIQLIKLLLQHVPNDGSSIGNKKLMSLIADDSNKAISDKDYWRIRDLLISQGILAKGGGRGGSVKLLQKKEDITLPVTILESEQNGPQRPKRKKAPPKTASSKAGKHRAGKDKKQVLSYAHDDKRKNNPHVGMVDVASDGVEDSNQWTYDPHLAPELQFDMGRHQVETLIDDALADGEPATMQQALKQLKQMQAPYLAWTGKAERTSFSVDTVSLHVHDRIDPARILSAIEKDKQAQKKKKPDQPVQLELFSAPFENLSLRQAFDFYKHDRDWANRLISGDSLLVMNSLLQKESMAGQVQMIYLDPPYGIEYGSNFQPFVNKRDVKDRKDEDLTQEPEMIKAFRDTWELGIHSYLTYLRDRLLLARELLNASGSVFVQISDENLHHVRELMDEVFGCEQFIALIPFRKKTMPMGTNFLEQMADFIIWYSKDKKYTKYHRIYKERSIEGEFHHCWFERKDNSFSRMSNNQIYNHSLLPNDAKIYRLKSLEPSGVMSSGMYEYIYKGKVFSPPKNGYGTTKSNLQRVAKANRLQVEGKRLTYRVFAGESSATQMTAPWHDTIGADDKQLVVQTNTEVISRCLLMTTDPGDLVFDPTCGSGTTAYVAEKWGRRWITCDTSRVAVTLAKQRLMTASYDYFELKYPHEGLKGGFAYKAVPHVTLTAIASNPDIDAIYDRMHPTIERHLDELNQVLGGHDVPFAVTEGGRNGQSIDFKAKQGQTMDLPSGEKAPAGQLLEWEVPFEFPEDWPKKARQPFDKFHAARKAMQQKMDESIAAHADQEVLYDQPEVSKAKLRITGPFTMEAVPFPTVLSLEEAHQPADADVAVARSGETARQARWRDELLKTGIRGKGGQKLQLADLEPLPACRYLHAVGVAADSGDRVVVSFGPEHAALEQRQVEIAMREAGELFPLPKMLIFCAFTFDPEAAKDIDNIKGITALKAQMNTDLLTEDLKAKRANNESFWLMGQPDVEIHRLKKDQLQVEVHGFDYFDTKTGELVSGGKNNIAMWELDTDYDDRSLFPRQVFFPMAGAKDGWYRLKKDIRAELDEERLAQFHGTVSLPFEPGENRRIAVKIIDDRGIESLKIMDID